MMDYKKFDTDGRFGVTVSSQCYAAFGDDSLGRGDMDSTAIFQSAEGREYFILYDRTRRIAASDAAALEWLKSEVARITKMPRPRAALRKLAAATCRPREHGAS